MMVNFVSELRCEINWVLLEVWLRILVFLESIVMVGEVLKNQIYHKTLVTVYQSVRRNISEDLKLNDHCCDKLSLSVPRSDVKFNNGR